MKLDPGFYFVYCNTGLITQSKVSTGTSSNPFLLTQSEIVNPATKSPCPTKVQRIS